jgi:hypothetical protein
LDRGSFVDSEGQFCRFFGKIFHNGYEKVHSV